MALLPARNILDGTALPVTSQMKTALGSLRDYCSDLLGTDSSNKAAARTALGAAASGANTDITSIAGVAATATLAAAATKLSNDTGSAPSYSCRAWVNFNGTGTVAIRSSGNVSSITDNGAGDYTVNFTTAMPDVNYAVCGSAGVSTTDNIMLVLSALSAGSARIVLRTGANTAEDKSTVCVSIFR